MSKILSAKILFGVLIALGLGCFILSAALPIAIPIAVPVGCVCWSGAFAMYQSVFVSRDEPADNNGQQEQARPSVPEDNNHHSHSIQDRTQLNLGERSSSSLFLLFSYKHNTKRNSESPDVVQANRPQITLV